MKKREILMAIILTLCTGSIASAFSDVTVDQWYYREVMELSRRGIVKGYEDGTFRAENNVRGVEALAMVLRSVDMDPKTNLAGSNWADDLIATAIKEKVIEVENFQIEEDATREDVAKMIVKALKLEDLDAPQGVFLDSESKYANILYAENILRGELIDGKAYFNPSRSITRAEMGALTLRVMNSRDTVGGNLPKEDSSDQYFEIDRTTGMITGYSDDGPKDIVIPATVDGIAVRGIGKRALAGKDISSVIISEGLTTIGRYAFVGNRIRSVQLPDSLKEIESYAFTGNELTSLRLPRAIKEINSFAFSHNRLDSLEIPYGVERIGSFAFASNRLEQIDIPSSIRVFEVGALAGNSLVSLELPSGVTTIGERAFEGNNLSSLVISNTVTSIGRNAFCKNGLTEDDVRLGSGFTSYWLYDYNDRTRVRGHILGGSGGKLEIPSGTRSIAEDSFAGSGLTSISIADTVTEIREGAFYNNYLTRVEIPSSVKSLGASAFKENKLSEVEIPSATSIVLEQDKESFDGQVKISRY